jgi:hypothetical protein
MFHYKGVALQEFHPLTMPKIQMLLGLKIAEGFLVQINDKFVGQKIMFPMP